MLPSILARQLQQGLKDYIKTTFPMTTPVFKGSLDNLLETKDSVFHEPYVSIKLPFRVVETMPNMFEAINMKYIPYVHQEKAFERLAGEDGRSTLIATGTGSGKTECFLYPLLDYCYKHRGERGIKALVIYPMNALASDQAKRIAKLVQDSNKLRGNVSVGMYVGGFEKNSSYTMNEERVITDHETMLSSPPDILLTNYKMLDYLLVRPRDAKIWHENKPETLKYIVVDEFHTFDGAQGTDLACLLRRLKSRLYTPLGHLCCIGTSATMGDKDSANSILGYASEVFGEQFEQDSVVTEDRLSPDEFFTDVEVTDFSVPTEDKIAALIRCEENDDEEGFLKAAIDAWFDRSFAYNDILSDKTQIEIGAHLMYHNFTHFLISYIGGKFVQNENVIATLCNSFPVLKELSNPSFAIDALYAIISHSRFGTEGNTRPFLNVQSQLWMRELRRLVAKVSGTNITYALATDLNEVQAKQYLPIVTCRDCGATGWASIIDERGSVEMRNLNIFYNLYFKGDKKIVLMYPCDPSNIPIGMMKARLCPNCMHLDIGDGEKCTACGTDSISIAIPMSNRAGRARGIRCPQCGSNTGLAIMGVRSATAISATISQMFASKFNDDKKTLTFSDNVQDAAHRAGFFNGRTWKFGIRSAIQRFALAEGKGLSLQDFSEKFIKYWHKQLPIEDFVSRFIAPNMIWMKAYEKMISDGKWGNDKGAKTLVTNIEYRLRYEIMLEYGITSRIGRTLEKSGCSVLFFKKDEVCIVAEKVKERIINELGEMSEVDNIIFKRMVLGFLNVMKDNGAFNDKIFSQFTNNEGKSYLLSNDHDRCMPGSRASRNIPRFPYEQISKKVNSFDELGKKYATWIMLCADSVLTGDILYENIANIVLQELLKIGIVVPVFTPPTYKAWAIDKKRVFVSTDVKQYVCEYCGNSISVSAENATIMDGAPCNHLKCDGKLKENSGSALNYYGKLFSSGDMVRVIAREHTGLLERDDREKLEKVFKHKEYEKKPWDTNVLSCTPTLEMGIDIGDLSSVILCSIPPAQAQFLQRVGRAGRKDGNALTVAVANARPHDLYFYSDPMEMMAGVVTPPKIFLQASAVLERQFVAYCMDSWIKKGVSENAIPKKIGACISKLDRPSENAFPYNFLKYVQINLSGLLRTFIQMFAADMDETAKEDLKLFAQGSKKENGPMYIKILESFKSLKKQKVSLNSSIKQLKILIDRLESKPNDSSYDEEIRELKAERNALANVVRNMCNKDVLNFLSDEGLLPNYAFPESGIILKAVLYRKENNNDVSKDAKQSRKYEKMVYEYNRAASSAISEFAPMNDFYVDGRKLTINQVDLTTAQSTKWRLCPNCSHAEIEETGKNMAVCPQCGSPVWSDAGQVRSMLKVQMVYSYMDYAKSLIGDESEERSSTFYSKQLLVDVDENKDISKAYRMDNDEFAFGYEFVRKATMREINFGECDDVGERLTVAGEDNVRKGFKICKYCGKIQKKGEQPAHTFTCRAKNVKVGSEEPFEECLFLYREFTTEALRVLVPSTTMDSSSIRQESFTAAFMLGMKEYFGNVDHLRACISEVPVPNADFSKQYLVIYDSVPGGTGYLKQLMQKKDSFTTILELALNVMEKCSCKDDPQKDGCYHCLYAYRQSQNIGQISRITAIRLLKQILSGKDNVEEIPKLGNIPVNSLFESELERRFIEALSRLGNETRPLTIKKELIHNKEGYILKIKDQMWEIEPQVLLDNEYGVSVQSRADFVLWPTNLNGTQKPIAIFTDGFLYHKDIVFDDTLKREAIRRSNRFRVWSLSWKDVQCMFQSQGDYCTKTLLPKKMSNGTKMYKPVIETGRAQFIQPSNAKAMDLLAYYLENPNAEELFAVHAQAYSLSLLNTQNDSMAFSKFSKQMKRVAVALGIDQCEYIFNSTFFDLWEPRTSNSCLTVYAGVSMTVMQQDNLKPTIAVRAVLNDNKDTRTNKYEEEWNGFWQFYNMMQFANDFVGVTVEGIDQRVYMAMPIIKDQKGEIITTNNNGWEDVMTQLFDDKSFAFVQKCVSQNFEKPTTIGYELEGDFGEVIGEAEIVWEKAKVAFLLDTQLVYKDIFESRGWKIILLEDEFDSSIFIGGDNI